MRAISGDADDFTAAIGGIPTKRVIRRLDDMYDRFTENLSSRSRDFYERTSKRNEHRRLTVDKFKRKARAVRRATDNLFRSNDIRYLEDIGELQHAPARQLRFLMAEPTVRRRYQLNRCNGWDDRYLDLQPNEIGDTHYDYRIMHDGHYQKRENGDFSVNSYPELYRNGDDELDFEEKVELINSNQQLKWWMEQEGEDPTSRYNTLL